MNEAVAFAEYILADYEMIDETDNSLWQLCGTNQVYTSQELYNRFKDERN
jgi:hypothetical protein